MRYDSSVGDKEMTVACVIDAPRDRVWKAWTNPHEFAFWFCTPPYTTPLSTVALNVVPGGAWHATMVDDADGTRLPFSGEYREVVEPERLVMTFADTTNPTNTDIEVLTITLNDYAGKTEMIAHQRGALPQEEYPKLVDGYTGFFTRLEQLVTAKADQ